MNIYLNIPSEVWMIIIGYSGSNHILDLIYSLSLTCLTIDEKIKSIYSQIRSVSISGIISHPRLEVLSRLEHLSDLNCMIDDKVHVFDYINLSSLETIRTLSICDNPVESKYMPSLEKINIHRRLQNRVREYSIFNLDSRSLREMTLTNLCLDLSRCYDNLAILRLNCSAIRPEHLRSINNLRLEEMTLDRCNYLRNILVDEDPMMRLNIKSLKKMIVILTYVELSGCPNLEDLDITGDYNVYLVRCGFMPRLKRLSIVRGFLMDEVNDESYPVLENVYLEEMFQVHIISDREININLVGCQNAEDRILECPNAHISEN